MIKSHCPSRSGASGVEKALSRAQSQPPPPSQIPLLLLLLLRALSGSRKAGVVGAPVEYAMISWVDSARTPQRGVAEGDCSQHTEQEAITQRTQRLIHNKPRSIHREGLRKQGAKILGVEA